MIAIPEQGFSLLIAFILAFLSVRLWNWFRRKTYGKESDSITTSDDQIISSNEESLIDLNKSKTIEANKLFLATQSQAALGGAVSGFIGTVLSLWIIGYLLEIIFSEPRLGGSAQIALIGIGLTFMGYPLIGAIIGAFIGRSLIKIESIRETDTLIIKQLISRSERLGLIIGLVTGGLPYLPILIIGVFSLP